MKDFQKLLEKLTAIRGISGYEDAVRAAILGEIQGHCERCAVDSLGNLIVEKKGAAPAGQKLMFAAHMDEVGFVVTYIEEDGMLRFSPVGGVMPSVTAGRAVVVGPDDRAVPGVIGAKPVHMLEGKEKEEYGKLEDMLIDIGASNKEEAEKLVKPGDMVTFAGAYVKMGDLVRAKAIDDRVGCALLICLIRSDLPYDCTFAFTTQEETGCVGAKAAAFSVAPDIGVVVEGTTAGDIFDTPAHKKVCKIGGGPVISFRDRGAIYTPKLFQKAAQLAGAQKIPWQTKEGIFGGNDSRSIQTAGAGARVLAVSVPVRYIHSAASAASPRDMEDTLRLLTALAGELPR